MRLGEKHRNYEKDAQEGFKIWQKNVPAYFFIIA